MWVAIGLSLTVYAANRLISSHQLFINADILTMHDALPTAEGLVVEHGRISFVGTTEEVLSRARWYSRVIDFGGNVLMPGFVDAHSHFLSVGLQAVSVDLNPPPMGDTGSLEALYATLSTAIADTPKGDWVIGFNYDNTVFPSGAHPDKRALDQLSTDHKIYLRHNSGHMGVANSAGLAALLADLDTTKVKDALGSSVYVGRYAGTSELNGLLQENAAPTLDRFVAQFSLLDYVRVLLHARKSYLSQGFTTAQNGTSGAAELKVLRWLSRLGIVPMRLVAWASHEKLGEDMLSGKLKPYTHDNDYVRLSTVKLIADGSPQGYTAYLSEPYYQPPDGQPAGGDSERANEYRGRPHYSRAELQGLVAAYLERGWNVAIHANGDAAVDDVLHGLGELHTTGELTIGAEQGSQSVSDKLADSAQQLNANALAKKTAADRPEQDRPEQDRPRIILVHAQTVRSDQLPELKRLAVSPSYFPTHTYYWGDWHVNRTLGHERAAGISPLRSSQKQGLRFSIHTDAPVTQVLSMQLLWSATERLSTSGRALGLDERIDRQSALKAMTLDAAWQAGLDTMVGSLEVGKFADVVELSGNPLHEQEVRRIKVLRTFIAGTPVYSH